ncbi:MAG: divergent polysaccharide deacetylase family protein [Cloacibacillus porcorum]|uniref:divergent polysaccharide deacetylase family protein n=1 Tax=Cloacibacillus porcorum TaxID=1197717 RepID=UPI0023F5301E|nr:divergent polysaccharide deacetylase family protein [Cloacibacillus porcorum]MCD7878176.1 divergent polysaccharide deacetylase family protein [Cloacibacillus porcorum]
MGKHYRKEGSGGSRVIRLALLLLLIAALIYVVAGRLGAPVAEKSQDSGTVAVSADSSADAKQKDREPSASADVAVVSLDTPKKEKEDSPASKKSPVDEKYGGPVPLLALIVDDGGGQIEYTKRVAALDIPLTWAIMPYLRHSKDTLALAESKGIPCLLHLPMQAEIDKDSSQYIIGKGMGAAEVRQKTAAALDSLPGVVGINNHRGSLATADAKLMESVMAELKERCLLFVDSRTSGRSVAYQTAVAAGVPSVQNRGFLDNTADKNAIAARFREIVKNAQRRGSLVVICHFRPSTVMFLEELNKNYKELPVKLVTIPEMLKLLKEGSPEPEGGI